MPKVSTRSSAKAMPAATTKQRGAAKRAGPKRGQGSGKSDEQPFSAAQMAALTTLFATYFPKREEEPAPDGTPPSVPRTKGKGKKVAEKPPSPLVPLDLSSSEDEMTDLTRKQTSRLPKTPKPVAKSPSSVSSGEEMEPVRRRTAKRSLFDENTRRMRLPKLPLDIVFHGKMDESLDTFLNRFQSYSSAYGYNDQDRLISLPLHFRGYAEKWMTKLKVNYGDNLSYEETLQYLRREFGQSTSSVERVEQELSNLKQRANESVADFHSRFEQIASKIMIPDFKEVSYFLKSLNETIRYFVQERCPQTLREAYRLALDQEIKLPKSFMQAQNSTFGFHAITEQKCDQVTDDKVSKLQDEVDQLRKQLSQATLDTPKRQRHNEGRTHPYAKPNRRYEEEWCSFCRKGGHSLSSCRTKVPCESCGSTNHQGRFCKGICKKCNKPGHTEDRCWASEGSRPPTPSKAPPAPEN